MRSLLQHHSALLCRSSSLSAHLKWMTPVELVSRCHSLCECSVIGVVTVTAEAGPSKRFPIVVSCLMCVRNGKCQRQAVLPLLFRWFRWIFSNWVRTAGSLSCRDIKWTQVECILCRKSSHTKKQALFVADGKCRVVSNLVFHSG